MPILIAAGLTCWLGTLAAVFLAIRTYDCCTSHAEAGDE
jgi:hypothetical protein